MSNEIEDFVPAYAVEVLQGNLQGRVKKLSLALPTTRSRHLVNRFEELEPVYPGNGDGERYGGNDDDRESDATKQPHLISMQHGVKDKGEENRDEHRVDTNQSCHILQPRVDEEGAKGGGGPDAPAHPIACSN